MTRGFDSKQLYFKDALAHIRALEGEIAERRRRLEQLETSVLPASKFGLRASFSPNSNRGAARDRPLHNPYRRA